MIFWLLLIGFAAFVVVLALIPPVRVFALKIGLVDQPGGRKQHDGGVTVAELAKNTTVAESNG